MRIKILKGYIFLVFKKLENTVILLAFLSILFSILIGIIEILNARIIQIILNNNLNLSSDPSILTKLTQGISFEKSLVCLLIINLLKLALQLVSTQAQALFSESLCILFKNATMYDFFYKSTSKKVGFSDLFYLFSEIVPKIITTTTSAFNVLANAIQIFIILFSMGNNFPRQTVTAIAGLSLIAAIQIILTQKIKKHSKKVNENSKELSLIAMTSVKNLNFFEIMRSQLFEYNVFKKKNNELSSEVLKLSFISTFSTSLTSFLGIFLICIILYFSQKDFSVNSGIQLIPFLYLLFKLIQNLGTTSIYYSNFQSNSSHFFYGTEYLLNIFSNSKKEINTNPGVNFFGSQFENEKYLKDSSLQILSPPSIEISNLNFSYAPNKELLSNISFKVPPGGAVAIIGESGKGKSTLLSIILGIETPKSGLIKINNQTPKEYFESTSFRIGYVGAEPFLTKGTIKENLLYGIQHTVTDQEIAEVLKQTSLETLIQKNGFDHIINEDNSGISMGQKQRICLARAILNHPNLIILDEATANLDNETEEIVRETIESLQGKSTIILVTHRMNLIRNINQVISL